MTFKHKPERAIADYFRNRITDYHGKLPPFANETEARAYIKDRWNITAPKDVDKLLVWYLPTLYPCGCPNSHEDDLYGTGKRIQLPCDDGHYRCLTCGYERNEDGSKYVHKRVSPEDKTEAVKPSVEQLSLLTWKEEDNET